ncbi:MAG: hypothetical protein AAF282_03050 [Cyanobacteria bacterium P01_A01_bin.15]
MKFTQRSVIPAVCILLMSGSNAWARSLAEQVNDLRRINDQNPVADIPPAATDATPSAEGFTIPSLWWQQQQQGEAITRRLIDSWQAYDETVSPIPHVDVVVNGQIWPGLNYLEQYAFITQFGESAKAYGYQLRIFTGRSLVGLHVCDFAGAADLQTADEEIQNTAMQPTLTCVVELDYFGQGAIRGR